MKITIPDRDLPLSDMPFALMGEVIREVKPKPEEDTRSAEEIEREAGQVFLFAPVALTADDFREMGRGAQ